MKSSYTLKPVSTGPWAAISDLVPATVVDLVAALAHLYFFQASPSVHFLWQDGVTPFPEVYGRQESVTIPVV